MGRIVDYNLTEELEHGVYVSLLTGEVAKELGLSGQVVYDLKTAALLHDIGKLRLTNYLYGNEEIMSPLVIEEMKYVRMHPILSCEILQACGYNSFILESVCCHHEDFDGSGFPSNLVGENIPLGARIIRVCDVFAALTTDRPYRKRFEIDEAISLMIDEIKHFDMKVFLAFQKVVHRVGTSYRIQLADSDADLLNRYSLPDNRLLEEVRKHYEDMEMPETGTRELS